MLTCIEDILSGEDLETIDSLLHDATFEDGKRTAGFRAKRVKENLQLKKSDNTSPCQALIRDALMKSRKFKQVAFPRLVHPVLISKYDADMQYGAHVDDAIMSSGHRSDIAVTVFLSDPDTYVGGELYIGIGFGEVAVKLPRGAAVVYSASTIHRVAPVLKGERLAAVTWVESHIRAPERRELLADLQAVRDHLHSIDPDGEHTELGFKTYANLLRMWAQT